jgi:RimJ/RimL family protein N-acetyltransferase
MRLTLPPITRSDEGFLLDLYASTREAEMAIVPWTDAQKSVFVRSQFQAQHQHYLSQYPEGKFQIINLEDKKIGRFYVCELENEIRIIDLTITPEFRGQGFGTEIIIDILQKAEKPVQIYLEPNQSINLFKRLGFEIVSDEGLYQLWHWNNFETKGLTANN